MDKWRRIKYQPNQPLYPGHDRVTAGGEHIALSRRAAGEGMVLLKNENHVLPLARGERVALFGKASVDYVKGGGGSGDVTVDYVKNLWDGMKEKENEGKVVLLPELYAFYKENVDKQYEAGAVPGMTVEPELPDELLRTAKSFADTAVISICRFSGESWDRQIASDDGGSFIPDTEKHFVELRNRIFEDGDFYLTKGERALIEKVTGCFDKVAVVLNVGGVVDSTWFKKDERIDSVLLSWQAGMEGGAATADILCGDVNPSGKLTDTFAASLVDYPSTEHFHDSPDYVDYTEDIYVGYRYFETMNGAKKKVNYPFGFGLSYTEFVLEDSTVLYTGTGAKLSVRVTNVGECAGKEVVQVYYSAPQGRLGKPAKELAAYQKTRLLQPGESQYVHFLVPYASMASYDDLGKIRKSAWVLEAGEYDFYVGTSVENVHKLEEAYCLDKDIVTEQLSSRCAPSALPKRLLSDGSYEELPVDDEAVEDSAAKRREREREEQAALGLAAQDYDALEGALPYPYAPEDYAARGEKRERMSLLDVAEGKNTPDAFISQLEVEELAALLGGQPNMGVSDTFGIGNLSECDIPNVLTADGPAGLRIRPERGVSTTAWPCATLLACAWNTELVEAVGRAGAEEVKENNLGIWLTPAINIHRSPLCGRNFEYCSEDPVVAGKTGAALVRGIQSMHIGAELKHFACNNKETNRKESDSRLSERALREIYLKGFEIVVKEAKPYLVMSSYNLINGVRASENKELLTNILRDEWGFEGLVTTDWYTHGEHYKEVKAGNDIKMGRGFADRLMQAYREGALSREEMETSVRRLLHVIMKMD
ncbi:MAG TPA: glycoside hydrolase family 3 C-terminal domain-containing protein [Candidatus Anaerobutyricum avicola]|nr:glycoside hydrolase family 3 C-terminal domain-containing protein [Candidatus Anaerobutyricum avicola]